jgi:FkbM family methyltransferase
MADAPRTGGGGASGGRAIFRGEHEASLLRDYFNGRATGFFVDVGAADPRDGSQSWQLEQAGWSGILVEPRPDFAAKLRQVRRATVFEAACSAPQNAGRTMQLHLYGGCSSLNDQLVVAGMKPQGDISVLVRTLDDILTEAHAPAPVDFVSIDVEGHESEVLAGFDLARWRPPLILIEDHALDLRLHRLLLSRGYRWVRRTGLNGWYVPADSPMRVGWLGWLQFVRKYYVGMPARYVRDAVRHTRAFLGIFPPRRPIGTPHD